MAEQTTPGPEDGQIISHALGLDIAKPCRYACSAFPNCGCEVEALSPPQGICTCGDAVEPGFLLCLPCWSEFHKDELPLAPWEM